MRHLLSSLDAEHVTIASSILRDAEHKLAQQTTTSNGSDQGVDAIDDVRHRMATTLRDIRDKGVDISTSVPTLFRKKV
jgi:hypothetical protein